MNATIEEAVLLDTEHLASYTLGDPGLEREVLQMFIDQSRICLGQLRSAESTKAWYDAAHTLKGSARGIGAFRVGMRAAQLEKTVEPLNETVRTAILCFLKDDLEKTRDAILHHLDKDREAVFI